MFGVHNWVLIFGGANLRFRLPQKGLVSKKIAPILLRHVWGNLSTISPLRWGRRILFLQGVVTQKKSPKTEKFNEGIHLTHHGFVKKYLHV